MGFSIDYLNYHFSRMFTIYALVLNVDRHWNNFGVLKSPSGELRLLTLFDFGFSLGVTVPKTIPRSLVKRKSKAKTVSTSFSKQLELVPKFKLEVDEGFLAWVSCRPTSEAQMFAKRLKSYINAEKNLGGFNG